MSTPEQAHPEHSDPAHPGHPAHHHHAATRERTTLPLALFGMPLGVIGLAGGWYAARTDLGAPAWPDEVLYGIGTALWIVLSVVYIVSGLRATTGGFRSDLKHPVFGPFAAYIPLIGILVAGHYSLYLPNAGPWVTFAAVAALAIVAAQLVSHWMTGGIRLQDFHPGYFVPVVAGANVASIGLSQIGQHDAAIGAFAAGLFFWLVIGTAVIVRLVAHEPLPVPLRPALSAFLAAAATSSLAWIISHPGPIDEVQLGLTGILVIMLVVQFLLIPEYGKLRLGFSFWIFTFPIASTTNYAVRFFTTTHLIGWQAWAWGILGAATVFVVVVALGSIPRGRRTEKPRAQDAPAPA
ncbi:SLAC1 family transporter [Frondihabitans cladoniiphilus]|uniref:Tellurite resistance protein n=1 Tax=Frondihabitans cladoniiphilus TaxID=715785 RepID=A0ABP8WAP1_9MICO